MQTTQSEKRIRNAFRQKVRTSLAKPTFTLADRDLFPASFNATAEDAPHCFHVVPILRPNDHLCVDVWTKENEFETKHSKQQHLDQVGTSACSLFVRSVHTGAVAGACLPNIESKQNHNGDGLRFGRARRACASLQWRDALAVQILLCDEHARRCGILGIGEITLKYICIQKNKLPSLISSAAFLRSRPWLLSKPSSLSLLSLPCLMLKTAPSDQNCLSPRKQNTQSIVHQCCNLIVDVNAG